MKKKRLSVKPVVPDEEFLKALALLKEGFDHLPPTQGADDQRIDSVLNEVAVRLRNNFPYFHPLYAGQMLKPPHPVARLAYALAMWINPNNHALDGGRESSSMEKEVVADIASMFGWKQHLGHLTSGGTMANLEALWVAGKVHPGMTILASDQAHYTHNRISNVLGLRFESIGSDRYGRMDIDMLEDRLKQGGVGTVVATIGTTATGSVDSLASILELRKRYSFRLHADAAYGGYFCLAANLEPNAQAAFDHIGEVDSIVIDPHKHGLQPYGCGCVLFRDPSMGRFYKHESPYTYFSSDELHLGEISLECSRPGASAVALWATHRLMPLKKGGVFSSMLEDSRKAALALYGLLRSEKQFRTAFPPELDILVWIPEAPTIQEASQRSKKIFREAARNNLHLALADLPARFFDFPVTNSNHATVTCLRSVLMKPEHLDWVDRIWEILKNSAQAK